MFDDWKPEDPVNGRYIWLPFRVEQDRIAINWLDSWNMSWFDSSQPTGK